MEKFQRGTCTIHGTELNTDWYCKQCRIDEWEASRGKNNNGWISVKDRLPEEHIQVLVFAKDSNEICIAYLLGMDWHSITNYWEPDEIDFWKPLPEPPKGE